MRRTAEVVIVGGGVIGASIAYHLASMGLKDLLLLERGAIGGGNTSRSAAILRLHYSNEVTARLAWESLKVFREFEEAVGGPCGFTHTGYLVVVGPQDRPALEANVAMQQALGIPTRLIDLEEAREVAPMFDLSDAGGLAYESESGYANPDLTANTFARRARDLGAAVETGVTVHRVLVEGERVTGVETSQGHVSAPKVVVAANTWTPPLLRPLGVELPMTAVRHQILLFQRPPELRHHPAVGDIHYEMSFRPEGQEYTLVGYGEEPGVDPDNYNQGVDRQAREVVASRLATRVPAMSRAPYRGGWAGLFDVTPDWHPVLDRVPGFEGLYCAAGFSGHGFKLSPMVGRVMAEVVLEGRARSLDISPLRFTRFQEGALLRSRYRYAVLA